MLVYQRVQPGSIHTSPTSEPWIPMDSANQRQAFRRRGDTEEKRKRYDWLPWEAGDSGTTMPLLGWPIFSHLRHFETVHFEQS